MQTTGQRLEPNPLNWFRFEHVGKGAASKLFYNEVPKPTWYRHQGHLENPDKTLYSFTHANQNKHIVFGKDTRTPEGRAEFDQAFEEICAVAPELLTPEMKLYPHELPAKVSNEPHFRRMWQIYRESTLRSAFKALVETGKISAEEHDAAAKFCNLAGMPSLGVYILGKYHGAAAHFADDEGYQAVAKIFNQLGLDDVELNHTTSEPLEDQLWMHIDHAFELSEAGLQEALPALVTEI